MTIETGLVSVVIPAYNAGRTLGATIESVCSQAYQPIEIFVVDDGSTDDTAAVAQRAAARDPRVCIISMPNGGVASARNAGFAASRGEFIAPIDADDLWHPEKLAKQVEVMRRDPEIGLVYTFSRRIDTEDRLLYDGCSIPIEGRVYLRLLFNNFIGNGSALLVRRAAWEQVGGYAPELYDQQVQGCEDLLFQIMVARFWKIGVARGFYTGYRCTPGAMSGDQDRMFLSQLATLDHVMCRQPETPAVIHALVETTIRLKIAYRELRRMRLSDARRQLQRVAQLLRRGDRRVIALVACFLPERASRKLFLSAGLFLDNALDRLRKRCGSREAALPEFQACDPQVGFGQEPLAYWNSANWHVTSSDDDAFLLDQDGSGAGSARSPRCCNKSEMSLRAQRRT